MWPFEPGGVLFSLYRNFPTRTPEMTMPHETLAKPAPSRIAPCLGGVPETTLWTLHNRANEARRPDGAFHDTDAVRIYESLDYDFHGTFGEPDGSHALRSQLFDDGLAPWLGEHPDGWVVELGCGLETQRQRCDNGHVRWLCVDVPESLEVRRAFLPPGPRCRHFEDDAFDLRWMEEIPPGAPVFVTAQGLFMYFTASEVRRLLLALFERFPKAHLMFDTVPRWFSWVTRFGLRPTPRYVSPVMPWGIDGFSIAGTLRRWDPRLQVVSQRTYGPFRGFWGRLFGPLANAPVFRHFAGTVVLVRRARAFN